MSGNCLGFLDRNIFEVFHRNFLVFFIAMFIVTTLAGKRGRGEFVPARDEARKNVSKSPDTDCKIKKTPQ